MRANSEFFKRRSTFAKGKKPCPSTTYLRYLHLDNEGHTFLCLSKTTFPMSARGYVFFVVRTRTHVSQTQRTYKHFFCNYNIHNPYIKCRFSTVKFDCDCNLTYFIIFKINFTSRDRNLVTVCAAFETRNTARSLQSPSQKFSTDM